MKRDDESWLGYINDLFWIAIFPAGLLALAVWFIAAAVWGDM